MSVRPALLCAAFVALLLLFTPALRREFAVSVPDISCAGSPSSSPASTAEDPVRVLVVGESWAAGGRLLPSLPATLERRLHGRAVRVCSMGFSGKNTGKIVRGVEHELATGKLNALFNGRPPESVVVLNGVNDQIQHVGPAQYASQTARLRNLFRSSHVQVVSAPQIRFQDATLPLTLRIKSRLQRALLDHGLLDPRQSYDEALRSAHPEIEVIPYEAFMPDWNGSMYQPDGIHLTREGFSRYGVFLGERLDLQEVAAGPAQDAALTK